MQAAAGTAGDEQDLLDRLRASGLLVRPRTNTTTQTGFCAHAALDSHAGTAERLEHEALSNLQAELFQARVTVNQLRAELEQARDDSRAAADDLDQMIIRAAQNDTGHDRHLTRPAWIHLDLTRADIGI